MNLYDRCPAILTAFTKFWADYMKTSDRSPQAGDGYIAATERALRAIDKVLPNVGYFEHGAIMRIKKLIEEDENL